MEKESIGLIKKLSNDQSQPISILKFQILGLVHLCKIHS